MSNRYRTTNRASIRHLLLGPTEPVLSPEYLLEQLEPGAERYVKVIWSSLVRGKAWWERENQDYLSLVRESQAMCAAEP
jgi:hypothetical protein